MIAVTFRNAGPADVPAVVELVQAAYRGDSSRTGWTTEAHLLDGQRTDAAEVGEVLAAKHKLLLLAHDETGRLLACCVLERREGTAYFGMFAVEPTTQGSGLGRRVLEHAQTTALERWGSATMEMTVIGQRADLIAWYERLGFVRTGEERPFPYGEARFGLPRREDLYFVVLTKPILGAEQSG